MKILKEDEGAVSSGDSQVCLEQEHEGREQTYKLYICRRTLLITNLCLHVSRNIGKYVYGLLKCHKLRKDLFTMWR